MTEAKITNLKALEYLNNIFYLCVIIPIHKFLNLLSMEKQKREGLLLNLYTCFPTIKDIWCLTQINSFYFEMSLVSFLEGRFISGEKLKFIEY